MQVVEDERRRGVRRRVDDSGLDRSASVSPPSLAFFNWFGCLISMDNGYCLAGCKTGREGRRLIHTDLKLSEDASISVRRVCSLPFPSSPRRRNETQNTIIESSNKRNQRSETAKPEPKLPLLLLKPKQPTRSTGPPPLSTSLLHSSISPRPRSSNAPPSPSSPPTPQRRSSPTRLRSPPARGLCSWGREREGRLLGGLLRGGRREGGRLGGEEGRERA